MDWLVLVAKSYRNRIAIPSSVIFVFIAAIAVGWPFFLNIEAHRAGYISGVLKSATVCGLRSSPLAQERLQNYMRANVTAFTAGFSAGTGQLEKTRKAAGYENACRLLVDRYVRAAERPLLIAFPSELSELGWPFWLVVLLAAWILWRRIALRLNVRRVFFWFSLVASGACAIWGSVAIVPQLPPNEGYWEYYWTVDRLEKLLDTVLIGFGPPIMFFLFYGVRRLFMHSEARHNWERDKIEPFVDDMMAEDPADTHNLTGPEPPSLPHSTGVRWPPPLPPRS
jgi:hypothetical protein